MCYTRPSHCWFSLSSPPLSVSPGLYNLVTVVYLRWYVYSNWFNDDYTNISIMEIMVRSKESLCLGGSLQHLSEPICILIRDHLSYRKGPLVFWYDTRARDIVSYMRLSFLVCLRNSLIYTVVVEAYIGGYYTLPHHEMSSSLFIQMFGCL